MKSPLCILFLLSSFSIFAQRFDIVSAEYDGGIIQVEGEVFIDLAKKSIALKINEKEMTINKITFKKGDVGELMCFKESIEVKQRFKFSPNKNRTGSLAKISHIMTYTLVQGFSNKRSEFVYHLIKIGDF
ncbi:MAG: hypothetical protein ACPGC8_02935 [Flavobacteriaceae bacterium]